MSEKVEAFYDALSPAFVRDYVRGNKRVERQFQFFRAAIHPEAESILVIGCGSGEGAHFIATDVAKRAHILAVDISGTNIQLAHALFAHSNIHYRKCDVLTETIEGRWDLIILPDVYEHIPLGGRPALHAQFARLLTPQGRILLTIPSEQTQKSLSDPRNTAHKPQVIDEVVSLADLVHLAEQTGARLTYFANISIWQSNDYVHAIVERDAESSRPLGAVDWVPVKAGPPLAGSRRCARSAQKKLGLASVARWRRQRRVARLARKTP
jgi:SAM-dependent methyltransferase